MATTTTTTPRKLLKYLTIEGDPIDERFDDRLMLDYTEALCNQPKDEVWLFDGEVVRFISMQFDENDVLCMAFTTTSTDYIATMDEEISSKELVRLPNKPIPFE